MSGAAGRGALDRSWFARPSLEVAQDLLGAVLVVRTQARGEDACDQVELRITETEAYDGANDPGSHAFRGRTARNSTMFGEPGHLYVYRHMGLHHCVNVVCGPAGIASAVLLRAGEVVVGADVAWGRRAAAGVVRAEVDLARGPARLAVALGIDAADDGADLLGDRFAVRPGTPVPSVKVRRGPRVGVSGDGGDGTTFPWRFWLDGDPTVSAYRAAPPRRDRRPPRRADTAD